MGFSIETRDFGFYSFYAGAIKLLFPLRIAVSTTLSWLFVRRFEYCGQNG